MTSASSSAVHIHAAVCGCRSKEWLQGTWNYLVISASLQMITHLANASAVVQCSVQRGNVGVLEGQSAKGNEYSLSAMYCTNTYG